jgi:hypothetical protein
MSHVDDLLPVLVDSFSPAFTMISFISALNLLLEEDVRIADRPDVDNLKPVTGICVDSASAALRLSAPAGI